jgi:PEP-CTERM motif-containing protein
MRFGQFSAAILAVLTPALPASAQVSAVIPNIYANTAGTGYSNILDGQSGNPWTVELIWNANQLTGLVGSQLTSVKYRLGTNLPGSYPLVTTTWSDYRISFAPSVAPSAASTTLAGNLTASPTLVRSGLLTVAPFSWPNGGSPTQWGVEILFDTPYFYTGGNLAMIVNQPGSDNPSQGNSLLDASSSSSPGYGTDFQMVAGNSFTATTGTLSPFATIVFLSGSTPVPEPSTMLLVGGVTALFGVFRRRRQPVKLSQEDRACCP